MSLFIQQDDKRSELQSRLAAELQERAKQKMLPTDRPDGVEDSQYIKGTKTTTSLAWVWVVLIISFLAVSIWLITLSMARQ